MYNLEEEFKEAEILYELRKKHQKKALNDFYERKRINEIQKMNVSTV